jgi:hypothetical protein
VKGKAQRETGSLLDNAIRENALLNVETLRNSEVVLADLIKQNRLHVVGGLYDLATGRVTPCPSGRTTRIFTSKVSFLPPRGPSISREKAADANSKREHETPNG